MRELGLRNEAISDLAFRVGICGSRFQGSEDLGFRV